MSKISICFFDDKEVRAVWDDEKIQMVVFRSGYYRCFTQRERLQEKQVVLEIFEDETEKRR